MMNDEDDEVDDDDVGRRWYWVGDDDDGDDDDDKDDKDVKGRVLSASKTKLFRFFILPALPATPAHAKSVDNHHHHHPIPTVTSTDFDSSIILSVEHWRRVWFGRKPGSLQIALPRGQLMFMIMMIFIPNQMCIKYKV